MQEKNPLHMRRGARTNRVEERRRRSGRKDREEQVEETRRGKKRHHRRLKRVALRLGILIVAILVALLIMVNWDYLSPESIVASVSDLISFHQGEGYPIDLDGHTVSQVHETSNALAFLTDTSLVMTNHNGATVSSQPINYSDPLLRTAGRYALVAEIGGVRYSLFTRSRAVLQVTADNLTDDTNHSPILSHAIRSRIISADVRSDGTVALVTEASQSYTTEISVYTVKGKRIFHQQNATLMALDVALSPNRRSVAVVGVQSNKGQLQSVLRVYNLASAELLTEQTLDEGMLFSVSYLHNGRLLAMGDNACLTIDTSGRYKEEYDFSDRELLGYSLGGNTVALALQEFGAMDGGEIVMLNGEGRVRSTTTFGGTYRHMAICSDHALLLTAGALCSVYADGTHSEALSVPEDGRLVAAYGRDAMVFSLTKLDKYTP